MSSQPRKLLPLAVLTLLALPATTSRSRAEEPAAPGPAAEAPAAHRPAAEAAPAPASHGEAPPAPTTHVEASPATAPHTEAETPAHPSPATPSPAAEVSSKPDPKAAAASAHGQPASPETAHKTSAHAIGPATMSAKEAQGLINLGATLTKRGDYDAAEISYRQVLNGRAPADSIRTALLALAHMHRKQGTLTKAAAIYERFLKDNPDDDRVPDALLDLGRTLRDMGAPKLAIARFYSVINSTLKLSSSSGFEHYQLLAKTAQFEVAETHFQSGNFAEATKFYSRLRMLDLAPADRARAHFKAAYSLQLAGDTEGAVTSLRAYLEQWPDDENVPEARYLLATSLRTLQRTQEALTATIELLSTAKTRTANDPKRWAYWQRRTGNQLANDFFQAGDIQNALRIYQGLAALSEDPAWRAPVTYQVALCYERLGDAEHATKTYQSIVDSAGPTPAPEIADIARMASSRLSHVDWRAQASQQIAVLFDSTTGQSKPSAPKSPPANESNRSPAPPSPAL